MVEQTKRLIRIDQVKTVLEAKAAEVERWVSNGDIPVTETRPIHKYGRTLDVRMFDPDVVSKLRRKTAAWRKRDLKATAKRRAKAAKSAAKKSAVTKTLNAELRSMTGIADYASSYPIARGLNRKIVFFCGPTNSGKTHRALGLVTAAKSAEILSPLRLLALEHFDALLSAGREAGMVTGEEILGTEDATHISRTTECADFSRVVEIGLIDEVQLLDDSSRGWAWTAAIFGLPARTLVLTGSPEALPLVQRVAEMTGEELEVVKLERLNPLEVMDGAIDLRNVEKGDAIIVFSKNDLNKVREILSDIGTVRSAAIYGALGPEVRRGEAERFVSGEADVLVATDAIGMGLNLPIRRVLFTTTRKYDGHGLRDLTIGEINQIAGRAGRYGSEDKGYTGVVNMPGRTADRSAIWRAIDVFQPSRREKFLIMPSLEVTLRAGKLLGTQELAVITHYLVKNLARGSRNFELADAAGNLSLARWLDGYGLSLADKYAFSCSPCDTRNEVLMSFMRSYIGGHMRCEEVKLPRFPTAMYPEVLEELAKALSLYLWLSNKFPATFVAVEEAVAMRSKTQAALGQCMIQLGGINQSLDPKEREKIVRRHLSPPPRRGYRDYDPYDDDDDDFME